jgi:cell division protein FtsI/penicillin-binding protein 2
VLPVVPNRGQILDRNGRVLATNYSAYTLEITPSRVNNLDATIEALGEVVEISRATNAAFASCWRSRAVSTRCPCAPA